MLAKIICNAGIHHQAVEMTSRGIIYEYEIWENLPVFSPSRS
jgi:hypothetical protein